MLDTQVLRTGDRPEGREGEPVLILMHGRGADPSDLAPLRRALPAGLAIVLARAPFEAARWGYGPGWAWYRYEGEDRPERESFRESQAELEALVTGLEGVVGRPPGPLFLGGFSQGGTMALGYALRRPGDVRGVVNFSGFVPRHPDVPVEGDTAPDGGGSAAGLPVFWGHGTADPAIPFHMAVTGRDRLRQAGVDLEARDYAMGHGISPGELGDVSRWLREVIARSGGE